MCVGSMFALASYYGLSTQFHTKVSMDQAHGSLIQLASEERMSGRQWQLTKSQGESTFLLVPLRVISTEVRDRETDCLEAVLFA